MESQDKITSVAEFMSAIESLGWEGEVWFRGQREPWSLLPKVFRYAYNEVELLQDFRLRAPAYGETPESGRNDEWLFLAQHFGVPTRLLDWTASALVALFFAAENPVGGSPVKRDPVIWALRPVILNILSRIPYGIKSGKPFAVASTLASLHSELERRIATQVWCELCPPQPGDAEFVAPLAVLPLSWVDPAVQYFKRAFGAESITFPRPIAVRPVQSHRRMSSQESRFTIHGDDTRGLEVICEGLYPHRDEFLVPITIDRRNTDRIRAELRRAGIRNSTVYPDFGGLAADLEEQYRAAIPKRQNP